MKLIEGKPLSAEILAELKAEIETIGGSKPCVTFIRVGEDPASVYYVQSKEKKAASIGIESRLKVFPDTISQADLFAEIDRLNADPSVHGILVQAPLPDHIDERATFNRVHPDKDVDGFNSSNLGRLVQEDPEAFVACTPAGIVEMIKRTGIETVGKHVVVIGRSLIVGKPAGLLFMRKGAFADSTVTICHSRTKNLNEVVRTADIIIAAIGRANFVTEDMVKDGAVVIDVGINRVDAPETAKGYRICGDVNFEQVSKKCAYITPVPGGVGLMTVALLMSNTVKAWKRAQKNN